MNASVPLPASIARQAAATPHAPALLVGNERLRYADLEDRANRLAHHLRTLGAGPESLVGVCLARGFDLVVALLAVWRTGAAYVPLDPAHPSRRRAWILGDTRARLVVTAERLATDLPPEVTPVCVDSDLPAIMACPATAPEVDLDPDSAAYVIHTSGSTGQPKGVVITHRGIGNRVDWTVRTHGLGPADRVLQKTTIGFDAAGWEIFAPLVSGGAVVLAPPGAEHDPALVVASVIEHGVTVLQGVPSVLGLVAEEADWPSCSTLRLVFSAGEPLHGALCRKLAAAGSVTVWNTYGPTECSIDVTAHEVTDLAVDAVPIGRPLSGLRVLVLDARGLPVPPGVLGELYVGGEGVGRGYLGRPDLTAERFVPDPYGPPGGRLYRTGDLVRWRADRTLEFAGRADDQLKINGVRIEPAEIEAVLVTHPQVRGAAVVPVADAAGGRQLAGYVTSGAAPTPESLRAFLAQRLPQPLVPAAFVVLDEFPLTSNGKIDRGALPPVETTVSRRIAPATPAQRAVAEIWRDLLGVAEVGTADDFFQLGGSSLGLARLANRLGTLRGAPVPLRTLLDATTLAAQAALVEPAGATGGIPVAPRPGPLPLSFAQRRHWFLDRLRPASAEWVTPVFVRLPSVGVEVLADALRAVESRHEPLRTRYGVDARTGEPHQTVFPPAEVDLRVVAAEDPTGPFAEQLARGFDLAGGPLWRALAVTGGPDLLVLITVHHIASDARTAELLESDLREFCAAFAAGRPPALAELTVQYADFAAWQRARATEEADLAHWRSTLDGLVPLALPTDRPRPAVRDPHGSGVPLTLPAEATSAVLARGREQGATPFVTLLTAYAVLLARYTGGWDVPVGAPAMGRTLPGTENMVGAFLNPVVLRCVLDPDVTFDEALRRVREVVLAALAHQDLPFDRVVEELVAERDQSRTPLFQAEFNLQESTPDAVALAAFQRASAITKTDLTLFAWAGEDGRVTGALEYATTLFEHASVERMAACFGRLLAAIAATPDAPLAELDLLGDEPADDRWNDPVAPPATATVLDAFETQRAATPDALAVRRGDDRRSYAELDDYAARIAGQLASAGVRPGDTVAVLLDRSVELVAALLGVWKAGAAYVPLDPAHPAGRLRDMCATAGVRTVVTGARYADWFDTETLLLVDTHRLLVAGGTLATRPRPADPGELAYVIFTSGSTGRPKGVQVTHAGLANHVAWAAEALAGSGSGGSALFSSVAFDLVVPNLWAPLVTGQPVTIVDGDPAGLGAAVAEGGPYSFLKLTPGHLELLGHQLDDETAASLAEVVVVAGEALPGELADHWLRLLGPGRLINEYGPTEASVGTCVYPVDIEHGRSTVPIGWPLPNLTMHVLDERMRPVPIGVVGELYVGGTGVARGYAGRPDLTAERFVPGPDGSRRYRTGDLVRRRADGAVEFVGRADDQVKIRGYRIEPGEVRAVLDEHPAVAACAVVSDGQRLVAAVVGEVSELAAHCAARLPDYLLPVIVAVPEIPLTLNGKLDRARIAALAADAPAREVLAPRDPVEERISALWTDLLGVTVGVREDFFAAGGHSILAVRLLGRLQQEFDLDLPIRLIFDRPTVEGLAGELRRLIADEVAGLSPAELSDLISGELPA
ncbi:hypothetical protein BLA60_36865 [Actinophytocola xinjiangensis]|uniref:Carrier domain-containing protein n=1 Tax=Actinophytocola xinjiangensis TaxID=485602 RepID=A0A7Z0WH37_9PSEU|nr:non-ribosomal peptide synthetase [Actinophytocola xinjiangensis]OLF05234.1 hypothetical protein BLA60_36865 [Actinophytocola xinjiangensis]